MNAGRGAGRFAWPLFGLAGALSLVAIVFLGLSWSETLPPGSFGFRGFTLLFVVAFGTVGALIASRHASNSIGWIFLVAALLSSIQELAQEYAVYADASPDRAWGAVAAWIPAWIWIPGTGAMLFLLLLFPDGHLLSPRWRWAAWLGALGIVIGVAGLAFAPGPLENFASIDNPFGVDGLAFFGPGGSTALSLYGVALLLAATSIVLRYRRSSGTQRQQLKWLVTSGVFIALTLSFSFVAQYALSIDEGSAYLSLSLVVIAAFVSMPVATGIAVLQYRLYDIDLVIKKTVVFALITASLTIVFLGALALTLGGVVGGLLIAVTFGPIRDRARRIADRIVYGRRATPYEMLSEFTNRIGDAYAADDVLPEMADVLRRATGADVARVWLKVGGAFRQVAGSPDDAPAADAFATDGAIEVRHQGETLGALSVQMPANDALDPTRERFAQDLASQAGLVLRNVSLVEELRESRRRIVTAQDERARTLERNIHDGAQQQLVALAVKQRLAAGLISRDPSRAEALLEELQAQTGDALENLRDLARGIYPPLLADKGLVAALEAQGRKAATPVTLHAGEIGRYPQEIESAVYFCVLEALTNVAKYARASHVTVTLGQEAGALAFDVTDDGAGFDRSALSYGTGLQGMTDRLEALGGALHVQSSAGNGTTVRGSVPVAPVL
ncbi:MAG: ATP-binding protein [Actinomycetota bacterium]